MTMRLTDLRTLNYTVAARPYRANIEVAVR
jgi:hypothetical protein